MDKEVKPESSVPQSSQDILRNIPSRALPVCKITKVIRESALTGAPSDKAMQPTGWPSTLAVRVSPEHSRDVAHGWTSASVHICSWA
jgi:hypothetical protein